jgi:lysyl-tRNA synthetase class 1
MDEGIIKHYEDFYYTERVAFGKEEVSKKEQVQQERVYRMSVVDKVQRTMPIQPSFKHCVELMNIYQGNINSALKPFNLKKKSDKGRYTQVLTCAWNWINEFATDRYIFKINEKTPRIKLAEKQKSAIKDLTKTLSNNLTEKQLFNEFGKITKEHKLEARDFFQPIYKILINKTAGPRLAPFILAIGRTKVKRLLTI